MGQQASKGLAQPMAEQTPGQAVGLLLQSQGEFNNPTGRIWNGLRQDLMQKVASKGIIDLPLYSLADLLAVPRLELPPHCYAFPLPLGPEPPPQEWPLAVAGRSAPSQQRSVPPTTDAEFCTRFHTATKNFFRYVDFAKNKCCVAGGFVEACLSGDTQSQDRDGDIDVFFYDYNSSESLIEAATDVCNSIVKAVFEDLTVYQINFKRHATTLNIDVPGHRTIQLVLPAKVLSSVCEILHKFDLDSCQFAFDGSGVRCTWKALRAWAFRANVFDAEHIIALAHKPENYPVTEVTMIGFGQLVQVPNLNRDRFINARYNNFITKTIIRAEKYARRGYALAIPGVSQETMDEIKADVVAKYVDTTSPQYIGVHPMLEDPDASKGGLRAFFMFQKAPQTAPYMLAQHYKEPWVHKRLKLTRNSFESGEYAARLSDVVDYQPYNAGSQEAVQEPYEVQNDVEKVRWMQETAVQGRDLHAEEGLEGVDMDMVGIQGIEDLIEDMGIGI